MSSPGIDKWIKDAPESWAKLAKGASKKTKFEDFKKKFFEGAEKENKSYLKNYLTEEQLKHIYHNGTGATRITTTTTTITTPPKPKILVQRKGKQYERSNVGRWDLKTKFVLHLASKEKPKSKKYYEYVNILVEQGRTRQAVVKKIQRTRKEANLSFF